MSLGAGSGPQLMDLDVFPRDAVTAESLAALLTTKRGTVTTEARRQRWRWWRWWWRREGGGEGRGGEGGVCGEGRGAHLRV